MGMPAPQPMGLPAPQPMGMPAQPMAMPGAFPSPLQNPLQNMTESQLQQYAQLLQGQMALQQQPGLLDPQLALQQAGMVDMSLLGQPNTPGQFPQNGLSSGQFAQNGLSLGLDPPSLGLGSMAGMSVNPLDAAVSTSSVDHATITRPGITNTAFIPGYNVP
mmetsp:Transcript_51438/g.120714  ORF Transcript_51438/g.120714 Transcript_51438/m.120714 type:complete len:161 (+) Transcript_51438:318-800(+)